MKKDICFTFFILLFIVIVSFLFGGCDNPNNRLPKNNSEETQIANPASVYCIENNGTPQTIISEDGSQSENCILETGEICDSWKYFRGECPTIELINETKILEDNKKFLIDFPWNKGESWTLTTNFHDENCLDFDILGEDNEVVAVADGTVLMSTHSYPNSFNTYSSIKTNNPEDMGNFVILQHNENTYSVYMHFQQETNPPVKTGDYVKAGQRIGYKGDTGWSHGSHLHFCIVDVTIFPTPGFITKPLDSWGFKKLNGSNQLVLNKEYTN